MKHRSAKTLAQYKLRRPLVAKLIEERPWCEACAVFAGFDRCEGDDTSIYVQARSMDAHELIRRSRGGSILDETNILMVCRPCHTRVGSSPLTAERVGLELPSWASPEMFDEAKDLRKSWSRGEPAVPSWRAEDTDEG